MAVKLKYAGTAVTRFLHPALYGFPIELGQVVNVHDNDAPALLALVGTTAAGPGNALFAISTDPINIDVSAYFKPKVTLGAHVDRSGTIAAGGTAQQLMAANAARMGFAVQNISDTDLWVRRGGTAAAAQPSIKVAAGGYYESPVGSQTTGTISIFGATTGKAFVAHEW